MIDDNTLGTQTQLKVRGVGVYSTDTLAINGDTAEPSPISYIFNSSSVGTEIYATLRIRNTSRVTVVFSGVSSTGIDPTDFAVVLTTPPTCAGPGDELAAGRSCNVQLGFDPLAQGARTATLHIGDNSPDGGEIVNVSGTGK